jgi:hypothetical protein
MRRHKSLCKLSSEVSAVASKRYPNRTTEQANARFTARVDITLPLLASDQTEHRQRSYAKIPF